MKVGEWVEVKPEHDIPPMFRNNAPTRGRIEEINELTGDVEIWVPIGDADVDEHSQACFHRLHELRPAT